MVGVSIQHITERQLAKIKAINSKVWKMEIHASLTEKNKALESCGIFTAC